MLWKEENHHCIYSASGEQQLRDFPSPMGHLYFMGFCSPSSPTCSLDAPGLYGAVNHTMAKLLNCKLLTDP